jgi:hypothetical protein
MHVLELTEYDWQSQQGIERHTQYRVQDAMCSRETFAERANVCWTHSVFLANAGSESVCWKRRLEIRSTLVVV